mgnify:CR=1 FL=1
MAYGDLVAMVVADSTGSGALVANLVTGKIHVVPMRAGRWFFEVMAINATSLLLKEYTLGGNSQYMETLVRLDLSKLDALIAEWTL